MLRESITETPLVVNGPWTREAREIAMAQDMKHEYIE